MLSPAPMENVTEQTNESSLAKGIMGALLGAALGVGAMFGFYTLAGFRFPLLGVGIGILTGFGGKLLFKGGDSKLAVICSAIALTAVAVTLYLMYHEIPILSIISIVVSASLAYRIASN
jgi:hypothetical protein